MTIKCRTCQKEESVPITADQFLAWRNGQVIQRAAPNLTPAQREMVISQTCDECWHRMFPREED